MDYMKNKCEQCNKSFIQNKGHYKKKTCSLECRYILLSKKMKGKMPKNLSSINANKKGSGNPMYGKHTSELQKETLRKRIGILHPMWKGEKASKVAKHDWVERNRGKAREYKCILCPEQAKEWCNVDHKYERKLEDYLPVCRLCHEIFHRNNGLRYKNKL